MATSFKLGGKDMETLDRVVSSDRFPTKSFVAVANMMSYDSVI